MKDNVMSLCILFILFCLFPLAFSVMLICDCVRWLKKKRKLWTLLIPIFLGVIIIYSKYHVQIEAPFETERFQTIKALYIGLGLTITLGIGVAVAMFGRKK